MDFALVKYDAARRALQEAHSVDEVKAIHDKAEAARVYARLANDTEFQFWAAEIKVRAERRAGELLREMEKDKGGGDPKKHQSLSTTGAKKPPKIEDLGITRDQSSRWQKIATIPAKDFETLIAETKENGDELTTAVAIREAANFAPAPKKCKRRDESGQSEYYWRLNLIYRAKSAVIEQTESYERCQKGKYKIDLSVIEAAEKAEAAWHALVVFLRTNYEKRAA